MRSSRSGGGFAAIRYSLTKAREAGGLGTDVLSPLESKSDIGDYPAVMRSNLDKIRRALGCS